MKKRICFASIMLHCDLWDETDIASVFLWKKAYVFFGLILRVFGVVITYVPKFKLTCPLA